MSLNNRKIFYNKYLSFALSSERLVSQKVQSRCCLFAVELEKNKVK